MGALTLPFPRRRGGVWRWKREERPGVGFGQVIFHCCDGGLTKRADGFFVEPCAEAAEVELIMLAGEGDGPFGEAREAYHACFGA